MEKFVVTLYPAKTALPAVNGRYLAYLIGKEDPYFLEYEDGIWYKDNVQIEKQDVVAWGVCPKVGQQGGQR